MKIILFCPEIPQNTGNIVRTCAATHSELILVRPLGFSTSSRMLKRSGLDYWKNVPILEIDHLEEYLDQSSYPFYFFSSKAHIPYTDVRYTEKSQLIFGNETSGLPPCFFERWPDRFVTIPIHPNARCLNLSNAVAIGLYEALRQRQFDFSLEEDRNNNPIMVTERAETKAEAQGR
ncbi:MAG: tRNA (cytidine(34)-2'-O)-methyltransferase [Parachlamydiales bacterium]|nr:tRNA (cytidine(34)-2'-O)-methyltransferase [Parachlamydiales bacterium]